MQIQTPCGTFTYRKNANSTIAITEYVGAYSLVEIPECIENCPVTEIAQKTFLSQKQIEKIILPSHIKTIADWAFAHMTGLQSIEMPANAIALGKQVFLDCPNLSKITIAGTTDPAIPYYTACIIHTLKDFLLFEPDRIGTTDWYHRFDESVIRLLPRPDDDGFEPVYYGWFEVEDASVTQLPPYVKKRRFEKASLVLNRLVYSYELNPSTKNEYETYIKSHMELGVRDYITTDCNINNTAYLKAVLDLDCINESNLDDILQDFVKKNAGESAALLLQYKETHFSKTDFFSGLKI